MKEGPEIVVRTAQDLPATTLQPAKLFENHTGVTPLTRVNTWLHNPEPHQFSTAPGGGGGPWPECCMQRSSLDLALTDLDRLSPCQGGENRDHFSTPGGRG